MALSNWRTPGSFEAARRPPELIKTSPAGSGLGVRGVAAATDTQHHLERLRRIHNAQARDADRPVVSPHRQSRGRGLIDREAYRPRTRWRSRARSSAGKPAGSRQNRSAVADSCRSKHYQERSVRDCPEPRPAACENCVPAGPSVITDEPETSNVTGTVALPAELTTVTELR